MTAEERAAEHARRVRRGRNWLAICAIVIAGSALFELPEKRGAAGVDLALALVFGALWLWARRAPVAALASAITILLGLGIVTGIVDRGTLLDGYIIRVAALVVFAAGLRAALAARRATEAH